MGLACHQPRVGYMLDDVSEIDQVEGTVELDIFEAPTVHRVAKPASRVADRLIDLHTERFYPLRVERLEDLHHPAVAAADVEQLDLLVRLEMAHDRAEAIGAGLLTHSRDEGSLAAEGFVENV